MYKDPFVRWLLSPEKRWTRHLVLIFFLAVLVFSGDVEDYPPSLYAVVMIGAMVMVLLLPYINMYVFVPRYLFKGKYVQYFFWVMVGVLFYIVFFFFVAKVLRTFQLHPQAEKEETIGSLVSFIVALGILVAASTAIKLFQRWVRDNYRIAHMENEKLNAELEQLKSQVNPHFLFNMLNNANVLTRTDPQKASEVLYSLSDLLRYQLYGSQSDRVPLSAEINFLQDLLGLEKIRRDNFTFSITQVQLTKQVMVPPLLFITFVENAVKHSADAKNPSYVQLKFEAKDAALSFECSNSKPQIMRKDHEEPGGLGLLNISRRLELLFPERHNIAVNDQPDNYSVTLTLHL